MAAPKTATSWVENAAELLREPDPGETPFLIESLLVEQSLGALVGSFKSFKTWALIEMAVSIVTGRPAFGRFAVPKPGPVVLVLEESGRAAFHRRLLQIMRGRGIDADELHGLHVAANRHVRLNEPEWQERILVTAGTLHPALIAFDPIARVKGVAVDEDRQRDVGAVLDFLGRLRDDSGSGVLFSAHTGHSANHIRGSLDFESIWESRLGLKRKGAVVTVQAEHREAEADEAFKFELISDAEAGSVLLQAVAQGSRDREMDAAIVAFVTANPGATSTEIKAAVTGRAVDIGERLAALDGSRLRRSTETRPDRRGRSRNVEAWHVAGPHLEVVAGGR